MSSGHWFLERFPIPKTSIILGSFVYNIKEPRQGYFDPRTKMGPEEPTGPETDDSVITNPFLKQTSSKFLWVQAMLSKVVRGSVEGEWDHAIELRAKDATEYTVLSSDEWLKTVCNNDDVKAWMEKALWDSHKTLFMVTGYRTLSSATSRMKNTSKAAADLTVQAPVSESQGDASGSADAGVSAGAGKDDTTDVGMEVPGEKIYEIQYRKVLKRYFSSHTVDDAYLESGNRWIKVFTFRGGSQAEDEDDAIEVLLSQDMDVPEGYRLVDEDGERAFLPEMGG